MSTSPEADKRLSLLSSTGAAYAQLLRPGAPSAHARRHFWLKTRCARCEEVRDVLLTWRPLKASSRKGQALCTEEASFSAWKLAWNTAAPSCVRHETAHHLCDAISDHGDASAWAAARPGYRGTASRVGQVTGAFWHHGEVLALVQHIPAKVTTAAETTPNMTA